ncbi:response regulator transcription factor [Georgenia yuyongxinii]|uniref:Response regulator transcription factor n=2 Tax=Georgenia yuyongxinii TaxID=2589797 RepID=A0A552WXB0_9MICO|nr:response regulator transcription factor [Georgenia yuyongxinii]
MPGQVQVQGPCTGRGRARMSLTPSTRARVEAPSRRATVAIIDDHPVVALGVAQCLAAADSVEVVGGFPSIAAMLRARGTEHPADLVLLELQAADSASDRLISRLTAAGVKVVVFTQVASPYALELALTAGAVAVVHKSVPPERLAEVVAAAARGGRPGLVQVGSDGRRHPLSILSPRERETLALYASGEKSERVAQRLGISRETVNDYISRIRAKYRMAGRIADTKVDLYKRAVEDGILPPPGVLPT